MAGRHDESTLRTPARHAYAQDLLDWSRTLEGPWPQYETYGDHDVSYDEEREEVDDAEVHIP